MPQKLRPSYKFNEEQLEQLKRIVPEAFKDGMLDFNSLYDALSDYNGEDNLEMDDNFYGLYWPGKRKAKREAAIPPVKTLAPVKGDGVDEEKTKNFYIEGDNLEVLKILQKSYAGKIKMIYIDPPYNTGNDFIYNDDFSETAESFGKATGELDEQGVKQTSMINSRAGGRFHSKWLSMMYPRLKLAHRFLSDDGVIFISIDDNEVAQLRKICDEIFGEENFVVELVWKCRNSLQHDEPLISSQTERIMFFVKNKSIWNEETLHLNRIRKPFDATEYKNPDNDPRGPWLSSGKTRNDGRPSYTVISPKGIQFTKPWIPSPKEFAKWEEQGLIWWGKNGDAIPRKKAFLKDFKGNAISDILFDEYTDEIKGDNIKRIKRWEIGTTESGSKFIKELFNDKQVFEYPKPHSLIKYLVQIASNKNDLILDFFSGSSTTAHAVMQLNAEDGGNRQFIMVQLPEEVTQKNKEAYEFLTKEKKPLFISEIGKERIRRAGRSIAESKKPTVNQQPLLTNNLPPPPNRYGLQSLPLSPFKLQKMAELYRKRHKRSRRTLCQIRKSACG